MADNGLIRFDNTKDIEAFLRNPEVNFAEAITGLLSSGPSNWILCAGRIVQASIKGKFYSQLGRELKKLAEDGKIKEDYYATNLNQASFYELLNFIDEEVPDEERFKAMKSIFFSSIIKDSSKEQEELAYELLHICKRLNAGDIIILKAAYDISKGTSPHKDQISLDQRAVQAWFINIALQIGHKIPSLVEVHEDNLLKLKLISDRTHTDNSGYAKTPYYRLTELGYQLCEFINSSPA